MNLEQVKPDINKLPIDFEDLEYALWRYDKGENRYYYRMVGGEQLAYLSATSFCSMSLGISHGLYKWGVSMGEEAAKAYSQMRADYGTMMHIEIVNAVLNGGHDFDDLWEIGYTTAIDKGYKYAAETWADDLPRDVAAFLKFLQERNAKVIFAELPVYSPTWLVAGCIDLGMELDFGKTRVNAIVDMKSGRKGFFKDHELQLNIYKTVWNERFSELWPVTHVFNWAPTDWRAKPKKDPADWPAYKLANQTKSVFSKSVEDRLRIGLKEDWMNPPKGDLRLSGKFNINEFDLGEHISLTEFRMGSEVPEED